MKNNRPVSFILTSTNHGTMIVNRNDYRLVGEGGYGVGYQLLNSSSFDQGEIDLALVFLKHRRKYHGDGVMAIDCGANIGVHTIEWGKAMHGWGEVIAFEAQEKVYYALAGNIVINNCLNVMAKHCAVSDMCGKLSVPQPDYTKSGSFGSLELVKKESTEFIGQTIDYANTKEVDMVSIDSLNLKRVDFIKIDVEGMEEKVLAGASKCIETNKPVMLIEKIKSNEANLTKFLNDNGYQSYSVGINLLAIHKEDPVAKHISLNADGKSLTISS